MKYKVVVLKHGEIIPFVYYNAVWGKTEGAAREAIAHLTPGKGCPAGHVCIGPASYLALIVEDTEPSFNEYGEIGL